MLDWLPHRRKIAALEAEVEELRFRINVQQVRHTAAEKENRQMRVLITALRDVNATLDARCNDLESR